jgi:hypothetical protein
MQCQCVKCGKIHDQWPAIAFKFPYNYSILSDEDKAEYLKELNEDFCVIEYEEQTDRFIRAVLFQKVIDHCEVLEYGVWVSLSEDNFEEYNSNFFSEEQDGIYFGYLCSQIPEYDSTIEIKTNVVLANNRQRPEIIPHADQVDNDFVNDYYNGISIFEAERRINSLLNKT